MTEATEVTRELDGRIAIVTGGSRGIGKAIAEALAAGGARVAVVGRNPERAAQTASELPGDGHEGYACDVSESEQVTELVESVGERLGRVTILVNNAGVTRDNILLRMTHEEWDEVIAVNLKGAFNMTRALARPMMKSRDGVIINVTSVIGLTGNAGQANYAASKAGIIGLTKSVARELASRNVRCNAVAPGYIVTDMTAELSEDQTEQIRGAIPLGRLGEPQDIASVVRFLSGPGARYITGQTLAIDGGMVM